MTDTNPKPSWTRSLASVALGAVDLVLPAICPACQNRPPTVDGLCDTCATERLTLLAMPYCPRCGTTLGPGVPRNPGGCGRCPTPLPRFARTVRLGPYAGAIRQTVKQLKFQRGDFLSIATADLLACAIDATDDLPATDVVVPIPAHWRRRLSRGRDHAGLLARRLGRQLGLPVEPLLVRTRSTPPQTHLSRTARLANVRNAFATRRPDELQGANILLVDDVTTTGATASECARAMLASGAQHVTLGVLAKSEPREAYAEYLPQTN
jgi:ComF family protein